MHWPPRYPSLACLHSIHRQHLRIDTQCASCQKCEYSHDRVPYPTSLQSRRGDRKRHSHYNVVPQMGHYQPNPTGIPWHPWGQPWNGNLVTLYTKEECHCSLIPQSCNEDSKANQEKIIKHAFEKSHPHSSGMKFPPKTASSLKGVFQLPCDSPERMKSEPSKTVIINAYAWKWTQWTGSNTINLSYHTSRLD